MARTTVKSLRLTPQELRRAERVRAFYPEVVDEAAFTRLVYLRGLLLVEAEVAAAGGGLPPGNSAASLAALVMPRVLPGLIVALAPNVPQDARPNASDHELLTIEESAANDVADLGSADFL